MQYVYEQTEGGNVIRIDMGDLDIPEIKDNLHLLTFESRTYTKLNRGIALFASVNNFFDYLSESDRRIILIYIADMHLQIKETIGGGNIQKVTDLSNALGEKVLSLHKTIQLYDKLVEFVDSSITIDIPDYVGKRAQDSEPKTYRYADVVKLVAIVILSKMLAPVFSEVMYYCQMFGVETNNKEPQCLPILLPFYDHVCPEVIIKLKIYIQGIIKSLRFKESIDSINMGFTNNTIMDHAFVTLVTRNFVNMDMFKDKGNYITAVMVNIKKSISTPETNANTNKVNIRKDITNESDERRRSQLEVDSVVSHNTADVPIIAEAFIDRVVTQHLKEHEISREDYLACYKFNISKQASYNPLNRLIIEMLFSPDLGGTISLRYLRAKSMIKLITVTQLICIRLDYQELAQGMTAVDTYTIKPTMSNQDQNILINYTNLPGYKAYVDKLSGSVIGSNMTVFFSNRVNEIVTNITSSTHLFQVAQPIWDSLGSENHNNKPIQFSEEYITELCSYLNWVEPYE